MTHENRIAEEVSAPLRTHRECNQCGWRPNDAWVSERCGSFPFGSCDGTIDVIIDEEWTP